jgi:hypothetical protein
MQSLNQTSTMPSPSGWLKTYYLMRAAFSIVWIVAATSVAKQAPALAAILLVAYPAWDALANYLDAQKAGGLGSNPTQFLNLVVSIVTAVAVAIALASGMLPVIIVFGAWAILSGLLQLATAVRRWKSAGAQWVMVLSGAQSAFAGAFFFKMALGTEPLSIVTVAPYAGFGAFYFLTSAVWLAVKDARQRQETIAC